MKLNIDLDDNELSEVVENGIKGLSDEALTDIAKKAVTEYLSDPNVMSTIAFGKSSYSSYPNYDSPRQWFIDLLKNSFSADEIEEYRKKLFDHLNKQKDQIIVKALSLAFSEALLSSDMRNNIYHAICGGLRE